MNKNYHLGLLYLIHLLVGVDGEIDTNELLALKKIRIRERIPDDVFHEFESAVKNSKERDIYRQGIELINTCTKEDKLNAFVTLYRLSEVDGHVHLKEVKLLLYSIEMAGIEFDDVVNTAKTATTIL